MGLPTIETTINFQKVKLPSTKTIGIKGWKVKEEKELLFASEKSIENDMEKAKIIANFLRSCVDDKDKFELLSENDLKKLAIEIRKISKGEDVEYTYNCSNPECTFIFEDIIKLSKYEKIKEFDLTPIKVNDNLIVSLKEVSLNTLIELQERFKDEYAKLMFYYLINSFEAVTYNGQTYTEFTEEDTVNFVDQLDSNDLNLIYEAFEKKSSFVKLEKKLKCKKCGTETTVIIEDLLSFLIL
jgi:hypothetical protein